MRVPAPKTATFNSVSSAARTARSPLSELIEAASQVTPSFQSAHSPKRSKTAGMADHAPAIAEHAADLLSSVQLPAGIVGSAAGLGIGAARQAKTVFDATKFKPFERQGMRFKTTLGPVVAKQPMGQRLLGTARGLFGTKTAAFTRADALDLPIASGFTPKKWHDLAQIAAQPAHPQQAAAATLLGQLQTHYPYAVTRLLKRIPGAKTADTAVPHVFVTGAPGAGKTTLARQLATSRGLPTVNIDDWWDSQSAKMDAGWQAHVEALKTPHVVEGWQLLSQDQRPGAEIHVVEAPEDTLVQRLVSRGWNDEDGRLRIGADATDDARKMVRHFAGEVEAAKQRWGLAKTAEWSSVLNRDTHVAKHQGEFGGPETYLAVEELLSKQQLPGTVVLNSRQSVAPDGSARSSTARYHPGLAAVHVTDDASGSTVTLFRRFMSPQQIAATLAASGAPPKIAMPVAKHQTTGALMQSTRVLPGQTPPPPKPITNAFQLGAARTLERDYAAGRYGERGHGPYSAFPPGFNVVSLPELSGLSVPRQ